MLSELARENTIHTILVWIFVTRSNYAPGLEARGLSETTDASAGLCGGTSIDAAVSGFMYSVQYNTPNKECRGGTYKQC